MRKTISVALISIFVSCQKDIVEIPLQKYSPTKCSFQNNKQTTNNDKKIIELSKLPPITLSIHFNIIYNSKKCPITKEDINNQIKTLNKTYAGKDNNNTLFSILFKNVRCNDSKIRFILEGITTKHTTNTIWSADEDFNNYPSPKKNTEGGIDSTNPSKTINVWIVDGIIASDQNDLLDENIITGDSTSPDEAYIPNNDGIILHLATFYSTDEKPRSFTHPILKKTITLKNEQGKNLTHEMGHFLGLYHLTGHDALSCGDDLIDDTPPAPKLHFGNPKTPFKEYCGHRGFFQMVNNYMDYTDDQIRDMFTQKQIERIWKICFIGPNAKRIKNMN